MSSTVTFAIDTSPLDISLTLPGWNTNKSLATDAAMSVGQVGHLGVTGSFMYFADVVPGNVDVLKIDLRVSLNNSTYTKTQDTHRFLH